MKRNVKLLALNGVLAAVYAVVTVLTASFAYGPIQFRLAEALCLLPMLLPQTVWGVTVGCVLANLFSPVSALDVVIGSLATLLAALWVTRVRRVWLAPLPMTICNAVLVGGMLAWVYTPDNLVSGFFLMAGEVGLGELAVGYVLGVPLILALKRTDVLQRLGGTIAPSA